MFVYINGARWPLAEFVAVRWTAAHIPVCRQRALAELASIRAQLRAREAA
jgi:hypothetical protein